MCVCCFLCCLYCYRISCFNQTELFESGLGIIWRVCATCPCIQSHTSIEMNRHGWFDSLIFISYCFQGWTLYLMETLLLIYETKNKFLIDPPLMSYSQNSECLRGSNDVSIPGSIVIRIVAACPGFNLYGPPNTFVHRRGTWWWSAPFCHSCHNVVQNTCEKAY